MPRRAPTSYPAAKFMESFASIGTPFDAYVTTSEMLQPARVRPTAQLQQPLPRQPHHDVRFAEADRRTFTAQAHSRVRQNPNRFVSDATGLPAGRKCHSHSWLLRHADSRLASLPQPALPKVRILSLAACASTGPDSLRSQFPLVQMPRVQCEKNLDHIDIAPCSVASS